jgi:predicted ribosome quality control (RQC) complex YloA/Tae2 family protein
MPRFERIVILVVKAQRTTYRLYLELFSKGNAILVDNQDTIMHASSYRIMRDREITRHQKFRLPPARGKDPTQVTEKGLASLLDHNGTLIHALTRTLSIGGLYAEELLVRANLDKNTAIENITLNDLNRLYLTLAKLLIELKQDPKPHIVEAASGRAIDVLPVKLHLYTPHDIKSYTSFNEAADTYFTELTFSKDAADSVSRNETKRQIDEQHRILSQQEVSLITFKQNAENNTQKGDLIYTYIRDLEQLCQIALTLLKSDQSESDKIGAIKSAATFLPPPSHCY